MQHHSDKLVARRLTLLYSAALGTIALLAILGQLLVQELISRQRNDSSVINIAGRQRMLSQKLSKAALAASYWEGPDQRVARVEEMRTALLEWQRADAMLRGESAPQSNSPEVSALFAELEPARIAMVEACEFLLRQYESTGAEREGDHAALAALLQHEARFLDGMDRIVAQYESEARARVEGLQHVERALLAFTLLVLALEAAFVFRPAVRSIQETMRRYAQSEAGREQVTAQLETIFDSVPALILFLDREGGIIRVNKPGAELIGESMEKLRGSSVYQWFPEDAGRLREEDAWIFAHDSPRLGLLHFLRNTQGDVRWLRMNKVPYHDAAGSVTGTIMFAVDVSAHKRLEKRLMELQAEEERKLGYDLHDGLGQHLSGILYLSRRLENRLRGQDAPEAESAGEIVNLVKEAIETVRRMSQGLRPLGDEPRALVVALNDLTRRTQEITGIPCSFEESGTVLLFEADVAEHLFRIAQEAINNAIRHSSCQSIHVRLRQGDDATTLEVADDGIGMSAAALPKGRPAGRDADGLGLSIMEHRAELMGGAFSMESGPGGGTTVRCVLKV
jgi:two-component system sensor histidine kinase DegS